MPFLDQTKKGTCVVFAEQRKVSPPPLPVIHIFTLSPASLQHPMTSHYKGNKNVEEYWSHPAAQFGARFTGRTRKMKTYRDLVVYTWMHQNGAVACRL